MEPKPFSAKLVFLCKETHKERPAFVHEFLEYCKLREDTKSKKQAVENWYDGTTEPKGGSISKLTEFWERLIPGFHESLWYLALDHFIGAIRNLRGSLNRLSIKLSNPLEEFSDDELDNLVGSFATVRQSFRNDGKYSREVMTLSQDDEGGRVALRLDFHAAPVSEDRINAGEFDQFSGKFVKYGALYYGICAATKSKDTRIRAFFFPADGRDHVRKMWGLMTASSGLSRLPVSLRVVAYKLASATQELPTRQDGSTIGIDPADHGRVSNDIRAHGIDPDGDHILTVMEPYRIDSGGPT